MDRVPQLLPGAGCSTPLGASYSKSGVNFAVVSPKCSKISVVFFDENDNSIGQVKLVDRDGDIWFGLIENVGIGARYGLRAEGEFAPNQGLYFDEKKLLVDPYAKEIDRAFEYDEALSSWPKASIDTAHLVPKAVVINPTFEPASPLSIANNGLIYELNVRGFSKLHPDVPDAPCGTIGALAHPSVVAHFVELGVDAIELMPVTVWIDERHLVAMGLRNAWGYNPICYFAPDPRLMPGGISDLRKVCDLYRAHGIGIVLDVVYNHTGESDVEGPILSFKGLDAKIYYAHEHDDAGVKLVNDTGCGNTLNCSNPHVQNLVMDSLVHWVEAGGVSGFRFDLAPVLGRDGQGFSPDAGLIQSIKKHPVLSQCLLIAEPWDVGPGGYQLGAFGETFSEWNDQYRDDVRAFWRGEPDKLGVLATRLSGSSDLFFNVGDSPSRGVNFISAHDGFSLLDLVSYERRHNLENGEENRDGHAHNLSWNNGVEGHSDDEIVKQARQTDMRALLATLFFSRGNIMICGGDEMGRTQVGNNNAYAQDNEVTWLDWAGRDERLIDFVSELSAFRKQHRAIFVDAFLEDTDVTWLHPKGHQMGEEDWHRTGARVLGMRLRMFDEEVLIWVNGGHHQVQTKLPERADAKKWEIGINSSFENVTIGGNGCVLPARSVIALVRAKGS